jgi:exopolyphosphatase/guanosine-5'-triphosphate,3'-diphosphate pyrophosphatase
VSVRGRAHDHGVSWRTTRAAAQAGPPQQVAIVDLGSNSWRLVVFSHGAQWWKRSDELYEAVRIAEGMGASGELTESAMRRGLETLVVFERFCRAHDLGGGSVHVVATSAIRDAPNREEFLAAARQATGYEIEVLSPAQEAHYGYVAAVNSSTLREGVVLDIGGGSLQLIEVADRRQRATVSFALGAVRMTERFLDPVRPARKKELARLRDHVRDTIGQPAWLAGRGGRLVATGGSVRNLAAAAQRRRSGSDPSFGAIDLGVQGFVIERVALDDLVELLAGLPAAERAGVPGIKPGRADIILAAAVALQTVLEIGGFPGIEVTEAGLREGLFLARTLLDEGDPLFPDVREAAVRNLAVQYESDLPHTEHVTRLALQMHESLAEEGLFDPRPGERELLWAAAMLHDVGMTISYDDHHKHSRYLILSAELPGFDPRERALIAQITRYHRKGAPKLGVWADLAEKGDEAMLDRCALLLRLAEHLERGRDQSVAHVRLRGDGDGVGLHLDADGDLTLPRWSVERYGDDEAFRRVFRRPLLIG